jgi:hypothetical protein
MTFHIYTTLDVESKTFETTFAELWLLLAAAICSDVTADFRILETGSVGHCQVIKLC